MTIQIDETTEEGQMVAMILRIAANRVRLGYKPKMVLDRSDAHFVAVSLASGVLAQAEAEACKAKVPA